MAEAPVERVQSTWSSHIFARDIGQDVYTFRVLKMEGSLFIHIGNSRSEQFQTLSMAMPTKPNPVSTQILGGNEGDSSKSLALQFSRRLDKQVYVSYDMPPPGSVLEEKIIETITAEILRTPNAFI